MLYLINNVYCSRIMLLYYKTSKTERELLELNHHFKNNKQYLFNIANRLHNWRPDEQEYLIEIVEKRKVTY